jgi:hypothetical protein
MESSDPQSVEQITGQSSSNTIEAAATELEAAVAAQQRAQREDRNLSRQLLILESGMLWKEFRTSLAAFPTRINIPPWIVMLSACSVLALTQALLTTFISHADLRLVLITSLAPFVGMAFIPVLFPADPAKLGNAAAEARGQVETFKARQASHKVQMQAALQRVTEAKRIHDSLKMNRDAPKGTENSILKQAGLK